MSDVKVAEKVKQVGAARKGAVKRAMKRIEEGFEVKGHEAPAGLRERAIEESLDKYEKYMEEKTILELKFSVCMRNGTFTGVDNAGITFVMEPESTFDGLPAFAASMGSVYLGYKFQVKVIRVDRENERIYVAPAVGSSARARSEKRQIISELLRAVEAHRSPTVWGCVKKITDRVIYVDILGQNILGLCNITHWSKSYVRTLIGQCEVGEFLQFEVTDSPKPNAKGKDRCFLLDRRNFSTDPWEELPMEFLVRGTKCRVRCEEIPANKTYWWGNLDIVRGIEVMGDFPYGGRGSEPRIIPGISYICTVKTARVNVAGQPNMLKVVPRSVASEDYERYKAYLMNEHMALNEVLDDKGVEEAVSSIVNDKE